ncbi:hypothetical protein [Halomonas sp. QHL1]|uniref:hypothetical protein n=1 Tax=Halomonas sp. QHL1 TaxID=1123773 RepID=UPI0008FD5126|nr:hypothetical protein [Halomonas sp. QHL1]OJA06895.1 hypothetical protein QHL1GM_16610 [Halomonas sp. QHL1]
MHYLEKTKIDGATWVRQQNFWLFGTATFKDGSQTSDEQAIADATHFFNILDRKLLTRRELSEGIRLERLVFLEHGKLRANTHIHFFIKGNHLKHYRQIYHNSIDIWESRIQKGHSMLMKNNISADDTRSEYCWKELTEREGDVLLIECCYLKKH